LTLASSYLNLLTTTTTAALASRHICIPDYPQRLVVVGPVNFRP
jgi:hypothetical protein